MDPAPVDSRPGPVQLCVGECRPELRARSSQLYSFVVMTAITKTLHPRIAQHTLVRASRPLKLSMKVLRALSQFN